MKKINGAKCPHCGRIHSCGHVGKICTVCGDIFEESQIEVHKCTEQDLAFLLIGMPDSLLMRVRDERKKHGIESKLIQDLLDNRARRKLARSAGLHAFARNLT